ncbi:MAG: phosphodiester glycosidase family protein [Clostridia bacterium]|jgi:exopolysaccharide biosynthesis protein|nr:phosphodiester glycosidase family protein [Clostridia bacterium]
MKKNRPLLWLIPLILLLLLVPFVVPSALPYAGAEESSDLPVYSPVELTNKNPESMFPLPSPKKPIPAPYAPHEDGFSDFVEITNKKGQTEMVPFTYQDGTIYTKTETRVIDGTRVYFTWVQIADPGQLRTRVTGSVTNPMRECLKLNALIAINGDWYPDRPGGIIYRNAELMRPEKDFGNIDTLIIDDEGDFHILTRPTREDFAPYVGSIMHSFFFGPGLVINGELVEIKDNNYGSQAGMGLMAKAQRQAICQMDKLSYLLLATEGPNDSENGGFTAAQMAQLAYDMGAVNAYNLDGGNSTTLLISGFRSTLTPDKTTSFRLNRYGKGPIREIRDEIYFVTAEP